MNLQQRTRSADATPQVVPGVRATTIGGSKLTNSLYFAGCPGCGVRRRHVSDGLRRCPGCRTLYVITVTAVVA